MQLGQSQSNRLVSGMRTTGHMHLGHYHGVLKNWIKLQYEYECFFFAADWHALTTHYENPEFIQQHTHNMVVDWLAAGVNPSSAKIFLQSQVPEHAELFLLLSMITPLGWLERVPTYKDQQQNLQDKDLSTFGFLGYPVLMASDILVYRAGHVPVGEDQLSHLEITREIARRFNNFYGKDANFEELAEQAIAKLGKKNAKLYRNLLKRFQEQGEQEALETGRALVENQQNVSLSDKERLNGYLEGGGKIILPEPQPVLTETPKVTGIDGRKMSKSYNNTIGLREAPEAVDKKVRTMQTDPARVRRTDAGNPDKCPVFELHKLYSDSDQQAWVREGCTTAGIGCIDCKKPLIKAIQEEQAPIIERAQEYENNPSLVRGIIADGSEAARDVTRETMEEVREAMGLV